MQGEVTGRVALVAGGSGAIGQCVSRLLAARGHHVFIGYDTGAAAAGNLMHAIQQSGGRAEAVHLHLGAPEAVERICQTITEEAGGLDVLVNCVGVNHEAPALGMEDEQWNAVIETNLSGAFRLARAAAKPMLINRWGRIIQVSSIAASLGGRGQINYAAAKAGLESMTRVLALELGRKGVLCNCVAPGIIETQMSERIRTEHGAKLLEAIAQHRFGRAEEVAEVIAFLASEQSSYINGQVIHVDGGMRL